MRYTISLAALLGLSSLTVIGKSLMVPIEVEKPDNLGFLTTADSHFLVSRSEHSCKCDIQ